MAEFKDWNYCGWQGISFLKPEDWEIGKIEGNGNKGYARLDDQFLSRVELRWQRQGRELSMDKALAGHLKDLEKKAKRQRINFKVLDKRDYKNKIFRGEYFVWEGDFRAVNLMVQCKKCWRVLLVRVLGKRGENIEEKAGRILNSLRDHMSGNKMFWSVFGFSFATPPELKLNQHTFLSGHLKFDFSRDSDSFLFERLSTANILLKEKSLSQWARDFCQSKFKSVDLGASYPREGGLEEGIYTAGRERSKIKVLKKRFFKSLFWHCENTNHIFGVIELIKKRDPLYLDSLASGVKCH